MSARIALIVTRGKWEVEEYIFDHPTTCIIGRAEGCYPRLPSDAEHGAVSRHHCRLDINPPEVRVCDLGSRNGTYVNGRKIGQRESKELIEDAPLPATLERVLKDGDEIELGYAVALRVDVLEETEDTGLGLEPLAQPRTEPVNDPSNHTCSAYC